MPSSLSGADKATFDAIFRHPTAHNLEWRSLLSLFGHLGEVDESGNGKITFTRNGQTLTLHMQGKDLETEDIIRTRNFLDQSRSADESPSTAPMDVMIVLDHSGARIFRSGAEGAQPEHIVPEDPRGHGQQVHNSQGDSGGKQGPYRKMFHESLAKNLEGSHRILLVGDGHGASSEVEHFVADLHPHHEALAKCIERTETADISHMTAGDFQAKAQKFFAENIG